MGKQKKELLDKLYSFLDNEDCEGAVQFLETIEDKEKREDLCSLGLLIEGAKKAIDEYGEIRVTSDREKYERAKMGLEDMSPHTVLHTQGFNPESELESVETMIDFVPEDNPLKKYWRENFAD